MNYTYVMYVASSSISSASLLATSLDTEKCKIIAHTQCLCILCIFWEIKHLNLNLNLVYRGLQSDYFSRMGFNRPSVCSICFTWWRHQMETSSAILALCAGNSPVTGEFPSKRPLTRSFGVFFDLRLNKRLNKQSWGWRFKTSPRPLWRHCHWRKMSQLIEILIVEGNAHWFCIFNIMAVGDLAMLGDSSLKAPVMQSWYFLSR